MKSASKLITFFVSVLISQKLIIVLYPTAEFIGSSVRDWLLWFVDTNSLIVPALFSVGITISVSFWIFKSNLFCNFVCGMTIGSYFSVVFYPHNNILRIEDYVFDSASSFLLVSMFYFFLLLVVPIILFSSLSRVLCNER